MGKKFRCPPRGEDIIIDFTIVAATSEDILQSAMDIMLDAMIVPHRSISKSATEVAFCHVSAGAAEDVRVGRQSQP